MRSANIIWLSGVSRISFRGGGFKVDLEKCNLICSLLGGFGGCSPEKILKNDAIWCVLVYILLQVCQKKIVKMFSFI